MRTYIHDLLENKKEKEPQSVEKAPQMAQEKFVLGDTVQRNGRNGVIVKIDIEEDPPFYVIRMLDDDREVGTEEKHDSD